MTGRIVAVLIAAVATLLVVTTIAPQTSGILALAQILLPHAVLAAILAGGVAGAAVRTRAPLVALAVVVLVACIRFGSEWVSLPAPSPSGPAVTLTSWNLELGARSASTVAGPLLEHDAEIVALQELTPDASTALDLDSRIVARYPYRLLLPDVGAFGIGILTTFPILDKEVADAPPGVIVTLDLGSSRHLRVLNAHPLPGKIGLIGGLRVPVSFDATERDAAIGRVRNRIDSLFASHDPFVVIGDYNSAPTEPAYARLSAGLHDVHVDVGEGPGWTWRPSSLEPLRIGLLRIDLVLTGPGVQPISTGVDCGRVGDHCILDASVSVR